MQRMTENSCRNATGQPRDADFRALISGMTCACAQTGAHRDAPLAQALFHQVEVMTQPLGLAAGALGIAEGDAAYLLAGLRDDLARDFVQAMLSETPCQEDSQDE